MTVNLGFIPRLMPAPQAAHYLGVSESKLKTLAIPRRILDGKRLYHLSDLVAYADNLVVEGEEETNTCDIIFGVKK